MTLDELAQAFVKNYEENPMLFHKSHIKNLSEEDLKLLEEILLQRIPNLIITHADRDTDVEMRKQLDRIEEIFESGGAPYFIDFSYPKTFVRKRGRL